MHWIHARISYFPLLPNFRSCLVLSTDLDGTIIWRQSYWSCFWARSGSYRLLCPHARSSVTAVGSLGNQSLLGARVLNLVTWRTNRGRLAPEKIWKGRNMCIDRKEKLKSGRTMRKGLSHPWKTEKKVCKIKSCEWQDRRSWKLAKQSAGEK